jgi:hypothetical protein
MYIMGILDDVVIDGFIIKNGTKGSGDNKEK